MTGTTIMVVEIALESKAAKTRTFGTCLICVKSVYIATCI